MWNGLVSVAKETYTVSMGEGVVPRPLMMPLVSGELMPPIRTLVDFSFNRFGVTVMLSEEDDYRVRLAEAFGR